MSLSGFHDSIDSFLRSHLSRKVSYGINIQSTSVQFVPKFLLFQVLIWFDRTRNVVSPVPWRNPIQLQLVHFFIRWGPTKVFWHILSARAETDNRSSSQGCQWWRNTILQPQKIGKLFNNSSIIKNRRIDPVITVFRYEATDITLSVRPIWQFACWAPSALFF